MHLANILKSLTPPLLWQLGRAVRGTPSPRTYQDVVTPFDMSALHSGPFGSVFDAAFPQDPCRRRDGDRTRLRTYLAYLFAEVAKRTSGDFLTAGVSYAVAPKVLYDLTVKGSGRLYHLVDPLSDQEKAGYCTDPAFVRDLFAGDPAVRLHLKAIPGAFPLELSSQLAFVHLETGDEVAELASLPYLVANLAPNGVMVIDNYGLQHFASRYDAAAALAGAAIFTLPTGQGVLMKRP